MVKIFEEWAERYNKRAWTTMDRAPFFALAGQYLPSDKDAMVLDIGAGDGSFAESLDLRGKYKNYALLDGNLGTVKKLGEKHTQVLFYRAPRKLPFNNQTIDYIHTSHLIEHLTPDELYSFMKEINRVLRPGGLLVISTPMLWEGFYNDLSHIKPYHPEALLHYLVQNTNNLSRKGLVDRYEIVKIVYRYSNNQDEEAISDYRFLDFLIFAIRKLVLQTLKIKIYKKNGYTLVLKKIGRK